MKDRPADDREFLEEGLRATELLALSTSLVAAMEQGLLERLSRGPAHAAQLAGALSLSTRGVERVLDVLAAHRLLDVEEGRYRFGPALDALCQGPAGSWANNERLWRGVVPFLRDGTPIHRSDSSSREERGRTYEDVVLGLGRMFRHNARELAFALAERLPAPQRILDIGAGSGVWSAEMLALHPQARAHSIDLPRVLPANRAWAERAGIAERCTREAGDYHTTELPTEVDRVVLANVLHLESPADASRLLQRASDTLRPGGACIVVDALCDGSPASRRRWSSYALHLAMRSDSGFPHLEADLRHWMDEAGFVDLEVLGGPQGPGALMGLRSS